MLYVRCDVSARVERQIKLITFIKYNQTIKINYQKKKIMLLAVTAMSNCYKQFLKTLDHPAALLRLIPNSHWLETDSGDVNSPQNFWSSLNMG